MVQKKTRQISPGQMLHWQMSLGLLCLTKDGLTKCFLKNEAKSSCQTNAFLQKEEIFWCKSIITNRHFPQEEMSCHRKKFLATRRFFIISRNFLSQEEISCHRKNFHVNRNLLCSKKVFYEKKLYGQNFPF